MDLEYRFRNTLVTAVDEAAAEEDVLIDILHQKSGEVLLLAVDESFDAPLYSLFKPLFILVDDVVRHGMHMGCMKIIKSSRFFRV